MEFIKDPKHNSDKLKKFSETNEVLYKTENDFWSFSLFDVRNKDLNDFFFEAARAVFAIPENDDGKLLLIKSHKRGWEFPGGHLTREELLAKDLKRALKREVLEESGYEIEIEKICTIAIIHNKKPAINKDLNCPYPERSVMLYYKSSVGAKTGEIFEHEVEDSQLFDKDEAKRLLKNRNTYIFTQLFE